MFSSSQIFDFHSFVLGYRLVVEEPFRLRRLILQFDIENEFFSFDPGRVFEFFVESVLICNKESEALKNYFLQMGEIRIGVRLLQLTTSSASVLSALLTHRYIPASDNLESFMTSFRFLPSADITILKQGSPRD